MNVTYDFLGRFEDRWMGGSGTDRIDIYLEWPGQDDTTLGYVQLPVTLLPEEGRFHSATYDLTLTFTDTEPDRSTECGSETATVTAGFVTDHVDDDVFIDLTGDPRFEDHRISLGTLNHFHPEEVPDWLLVEGASGHVEVELTYDEQLTLETTHLSKDEIDEHQDRYY